jgi:Flp pilus assembly protein protease CpaA
VISLSNWANLLMISGILGAAVYSDLRSHRIPNNLIVLGLILAIIFQLVANGAHGLLFGFLAALIGLGCFMPFYALRAMGAGDVKLMAVVGLFTSPRGVLYAIVLSLVAGGVCALGYLIWRATRAYVGSVVQEGISAGTVAAFVAARLARRDRLPFALPIAVGSATACLIQGLSLGELAAWL